MDFELTNDGYTIDLETFALDRRVEAGCVCYALSGVVDCWNGGTHTYKWTHRINQLINDGWDQYQPGEYIYGFVVEVK